MDSKTLFSLIFLAGGTGKRMQASLPKQYQLLQNKPLALYSFEVFTAMPEMVECVIVCEPAYQSIFLDALKNKDIQFQFALPGERRQDSVWNGLQKLESSANVCIHDSARPLITSQLVRNVVDEANKWGAAVCGVRSKSTIKICDAKQKVLQTPERSSLWEIQTPQVARLDLLKEGFEYVNRHQLTVTDDASLIEAIYKPVKVVEGSYKNIKVTTPGDLDFLEFLLSRSCSVTK